MAELTAVSLFSGCGGFDQGAQQAGIRIIWANDYDLHAAAAYRSIFPEVNFHLDDIRKIKSFPAADVLIGCYPCTGFSVAARRRWKDQSVRNLKDNHDNFLYREYMRALRQIKPRFLFVENVRGMVSADDGWFFEKQLNGFRRHGYKVTYALLKAEDYGVPQARRRMFIVGVRSDQKNIHYRFSDPTHSKNGTISYKVMRDAIWDLDGSQEGNYYAGSFHGHYLTRNRKRSWDDLSYTIVADADHVPLHPSGQPMKFVSKDNWSLQGNGNRRLSWVECARLQGLPDGVMPSGTLADKYRVVGNAVPPALGYAILRPIIESLRKR